MIENYVHWNEDIGEWQLVRMAACFVYKLMKYELLRALIKPRKKLVRLSSVLLCTVGFTNKLFFLLTEMCCIYRQQYEETDTCPG